MLVTVVFSINNNNCVINIYYYYIIIIIIIIIIILYYIIITIIIIIIICISILLIYISCDNISKAYNIYIIVFIERIKITKGNIRKSQSSAKNCV
jgi:hypothetical protein